MSSWTERVSPRHRVLGERLLGLARCLFGTRTGGTIALSSVLFTALFLKLGILINDTYTVTNTLVAVADGHLHVEEVVVGQFPPTTPGMSFVDGRLYGRNYGLVFLSLPSYYLITGVESVLDLRLALVGGWCLGLTGLFVLVDERLDAGGRLALIGSVVSLIAFALNVPGATDVGRSDLYVLALQSTTMIATALTAVFAYRLVRSLRDERAGLVAGLGVVLATPLSFWSSIPKRHALMAAFVMMALFTYHRSIQSRDIDPRRALRFRALSYGLVGFTAWIHAGETAFLLVGLGLYDVTLGHGLRLNARRAASLGGAVLISMLPFFVLNTVISGNPLIPPILNQSYANALEPVLAGNTRTVVGAIAEPITNPVPDVGTSAGGGAETAVDAEATGSTGSSGAVAARVADVVSRGSASLVALTQPQRLFVVFVDSQRAVIAGETVWEGGVNLAVLEATPVFAAGLVAARHVGSRLRDGIGRVTLDHPSIVGLAAVWIIAYILLYLHELPLKVMYTVRYLVPAMPLLLVLIVQAGAFQELLDEWRFLVWSYVVAVIIGGQLFVIGLWYFGISHGQAFQAHGAANLVAAALLAVWSLAAGHGGRNSARLGAALFGIASGLTTVFLLLSGTIYLDSMGPTMLPLVEQFVDSTRLFQ